MSLWCPWGSGGWESITCNLVLGYSPYISLNVSFAKTDKLRVLHSNHSISIKEYIIYVSENINVKISLLSWHPRQPFDWVLAFFSWIIQQVLTVYKSDTTRPSKDQRVFTRSAHLIFSVSKTKSVLLLLIFTILLPNWKIANKIEIKYIKRGKQNYEPVPTLINQINDIEINPSHHIFTK